MYDVRYNAIPNIFVTTKHVYLNANYTPQAKFWGMECLDITLPHAHHAPERHIAVVSFDCNYKPHVLVYYGLDRNAPHRANVLNCTSFDVFTLVKEYLWLRQRFCRGETEDSVRPERLPSPAGGDIRILLFSACNFACEAIYL